jgi:ABC-type multidrug transport system ATPase subunit
MTSPVFAPPIAIHVEHLWVVKGGGLFANQKSILQDVNFQVAPGTFAAVVGPNGAGKTTLFKALVGDRPFAGQILLSQDPSPEAVYENLYDNPEYWLQKIGYVPVDNVLHEELTIHQALIHIGRLRLPGMSDADIDVRINDRLERLGFSVNDDRLNQPVRTLSSGERKKVNIAAELLTDPPLLLLDEPTSNLDPNAERDLMDSLKRLAGQHNDGRGPTILLITHTLESLDRCDQVVFIANSRLKAEGNPTVIFNQLEGEVRADPARGRKLPADANQFERWAAIFDYHETNEAIAQRTTKKAPLASTHPLAPRREILPDTFWRQFKILSSRYFLGRYNDWGGIATLLFSGFIAGFLMLIAPSQVFLEAIDASAARQTIVLFVILVVITGAFNTHREISKEFRIYAHERAKGLNPLAYLLSKVVWLSVVLGFLGCLIMLALTGFPLSRIAVIIAGIVLIGVGVALLLSNQVIFRQLSTGQRLWRFMQIGLIVLPLFLAAIVQLQNKELPIKPVAASSVELAIIITLSLTGIAALVTGLLVSSAVGGNNDRATQFVIAIIIANVILAFSVLVVGSPQFRVFFQTLEPFTATHWGYGGFSSSLNVYCWAGSLKFDEFNSSGHLISIWLYLIGYCVIAIGLAVVALRFGETWLDRGRVLRSLLRQRWTWLYVIASALILSWSVFLAHQSTDYYALTFYDALYGSNRYANVESAHNASFVQQLNGQISQSACLAPDVAAQSADAPGQGK